MLLLALSQIFQVVKNSAYLPVYQRHLCLLNTDTGCCSVSQQEVSLNQLVRMAQSLRALLWKSQGLICAPTFRFRRRERPKHWM